MNTLLSIGIFFLPLVNTNNCLPAVSSYNYMNCNKIIPCDSISTKIKDFNFIEDFQILINNDTLLIGDLKKQLKEKPTIIIFDKKEYFTITYNSKTQKVSSFKYRIEYKKAGITFLTENVYKEDSNTPVDSLEIGAIIFSKPFKLSMRSGIHMNSTKEEILKQYKQDDIDINEANIFIKSRRTYLMLSKKGKVVSIRMYRG